MSNKMPPGGIKLICAILLIPYFLVFISSVFSVRMISLSDAKKVELMHSDVYKKFNIDSIEKFDMHFKTPATQISNFWFLVNFVIILIIVFGLLNLKRWARVMIISYAVFHIASKILLFNSRAFTEKSSILGAIFFSVVWVIIIYYFITPKVRALFGSGRGLNLSKNKSR